MTKKIIVWHIETSDGLKGEINSIDGKMQKVKGSFEWMGGQCVGTIKQWAEMTDAKMTKLLPCNK